jgi:hypothetical protein
VAEASARTCPRLPTQTGSGLVGKCDTALLIRRAWAIPTTVVGWALVAVIVAIWARAEPGAEESTRFWELRGDAT